MVEKQDFTEEGPVMPPSASEKADSGGFVPKLGGVKKDIPVAILSYISILCLVPLLLKPDNEFIKFHAKQGLVLLIGWFFAWIPWVGWPVGVILIVFSILGIINVLEGKKKKLPVVGDLAEKFNF